MPRRGLHPALRAVTVVLRNGASVRMGTAARANAAPVTLSVVSSFFWKEADGGS